MVMSAMLAEDLRDSVQRLVDMINVELASMVGAINLGEGESAIDGVRRCRRCLVSRCFVHI